MTNGAVRRRLPKQECLPSTPSVPTPPLRAAKPSSYSNLLPQFGNALGAGLARVSAPGLARFSVPRLPARPFPRRETKFVFKLAPAVWKRPSGSRRCLQVRPLGLRRGFGGASAGFWRGKSGAGSNVDPQVLSEGDLMSS